MSVKDKLHELLAEAKDELHRIEGLAVSELNRVEEAIEAAKSAVSSMLVTEPEKPAAKPAAKED